MSETSSTVKTYELSDLTIVAASPEQAKVGRQNTFPYWGAPRGFTMEKYLERDEIMEKEEWGADNQLITWVLVPRASPSTTTEILTHCETFRRTAFSIAPGSADLKEVTAYGIASVYTPEQYRKRGYGKRMLQLLHYVLAPTSSLPPYPLALFGPPPPTPPANRSLDASFSVLYSDIGPHFYRSCTQGAGPESKDGWVEMGSVGRFWVLPDTKEGGAGEGQGEKGGEEGWEWLDRAGVKAVEEEMKRRIVESQRKAGTGKDGKRAVGFLPTGGLLSLHPLRSLLSDPPSPSSSPPRTFGLRLPSSSTSPSTSPDPIITYITTLETAPYKTLLITHLSGVFPFSAVERAARREGCDRVEIWGDDAVSREWKTTGEEKEGEWLERSDHLSALADYESGGEVKWRLNEKYAWC